MKTEMGADDTGRPMQSACPAGLFCGQHFHFSSTIWEQCQSLPIPLNKPVQTVKVMADCPICYSIEMENMATISFQ